MELHPQSIVRVTPHFYEHIPTTLFWRLFDPKIDVAYPIHRRKLTGYTAIAYALSSAAAKKLVSIIETHGFPQSLDSMLDRMIDLDPACYVVQPLLVNLPTTSNKNQLHADDSDLWHNKDVVTGAPKITFPNDWMPCL